MSQPNKIDDFFNTETTAKFQTGNLLRSRPLVMTKLALLIVAAVLGLTLLVFPTLKKDINEFAIDLVIPDGDIEKMSIEKTVLYITDAKGRVNNFTAQLVKETKAGSQEYNLSAPEISVPLNDDEWVNIRSSEGYYNQPEAMLHLPHKVELFYTRGFTLEVRDLLYDFKKSLGYSRRPVIGYGFLGHLNSEGMEFSASDNKLTFTGKTTIIIDEDNLKKETN